MALFEAEGRGWIHHCGRCYRGWDAEVPAEVPQAQRSGRLSESRRSDTSSMLLLEAMQRGRAQMPR